MASKIKDILTAQDGERIKSTLESISDVKKSLAQADAAGIDISDMNKRLQAATDRLNRVYSSYFPG